MKLDFQVMEALELLERERGVPVDTILDALANGLVSAYKRAPGAAEEARVVIDPDAGDIVVYAQELDEDGNVVREWEDTPDDFGRIAAQTAKQVIAQRLRDAKREQVFGIYEGREGDLITGIVQQVDHRYSILDLGDAEALMPGSERIPYERLDRGNRVKALIIEVRGEAKGPQIVVSRSHPDFVRRLLELEVPELLDGTIEIKAIAREPGHRTKIAVSSNDPNVDPKGACVGARGSRVRQVVNELRSEKVDVVQWRDDPAQFIAEALGPAKVKEVRINEDEKEAIVIVNDHQLSLAIGREGQNARLAARLSGYRVDIRSESEERGEVKGEDAAGGELPAATAQPETSTEKADTTIEEPAAEEAAVTEEPESEEPGTEEAAVTEEPGTEEPGTEEPESEEPKSEEPKSEEPKSEEEDVDDVELPAAEGESPVPVSERPDGVADGDVEQETAIEADAGSEAESSPEEDSDEANQV